MPRSEAKSLFTADLILPAIGDAFRKLNPRELIRNPVMFTTATVAVLLTVLLAVGQDHLAIGFKLQLVVWLWLTVLFGTFAESLAEGRGKAQAASLRAAKAELTAKRLRGDAVETVPASLLRMGDVVLVETGDLIPSDGEVIAGVGQRSGHHRRIRAGHQGSGRRPQRGDGGDARHFRPDPCSRHGQSRAGLSRSHDRPGGGCRTAEDPQ